MILFHLEIVANITTNINIWYVIGQNNQHEFPQWKSWRTKDYRKVSHAPLAVSMLNIRLWLSCLDPLVSLFGLPIFW